MQTHKFIADYEILRELMHLILQYGTVTQTSLHEKSISPSKYNKIKPLLMTILGDEIEDRRYTNGAQRSLHLTSDVFSDGFHSIANTFMVKSMKPDELMIRLLILQILTRNPGLTRAEILDAYFSIYSDQTDIKESTFFNQIRHLEAYGMITRINDSAPYQWEVCTEKMAEIMKSPKLEQFVSCIRHMKAPEICGEQLYRTICDFTPDSLHENLFIMKALNIGYVLDDEIVYALLNAIEESCLVSFDYQNQADETHHFTDILPVKVISVEPTGRRYLFGINLFMPEHHPTLFWLDRLYALEVGQPDSTYTAEEKQAVYASSVYYYAGSLHRRSDTLKRYHLLCEKGSEDIVRRYFPDTEFDLNQDGPQNAYVYAGNPRELKPFLRENADKIRLLPDDDSALADEMRQEAALWRKLYGIES